MFKIYAKPILNNHQPYIYNFGNTTYATKTPRLVTFSNDTYKNSCFYAESLKKVFCKNDSPLGNCNNLISMHNGTIDTKCTTKLPWANYITQINDSIYFTIVSPLDLNITCENNTDQLHLKEPTKILGISNCTLTTTGLSTFMNNSKYQLTPIPAMEKHTNKYQILYLFYLCVFCFLLIPNLIFSVLLVMEDMARQNQEKNNTITFASFQGQPNEAQEYILYPPTYRESLI